MPIGADLAVAIEALLAKDLQANGGPITTALERSGGFTNLHRSAMVRIRDGIQSCDSIDDFLSEWDDVPEIGRIAKLCIAHLILAAERQSVLGEMIQGGRPPVEALRSLKGSWLSVIADQANPAERRRDVRAVFKGIGIITFNYDRCIEQYLMARFVNTAGLGRSDAVNALAEIPIHHAYGSLGDITNPHATVEFGADDVFMSKAAGGIATYTEDLETARVGQIRDLVASAEKLVFLGCAFHGQNLEVLFGDNPPHGGGRLGHRLWHESTSKGCCIERPPVANAIDQA